MKDRSVEGKMYLGGWPGSEMRTGLSRRSGGRCWGSRVCCLFGTVEYGIGWAMPGMKTTTGTFPIRVVLENDLLGGDDLGAVGTGLGGLGIAVEVAGALEEVRSSPATVSWRSCVHCPSLASGLRGGLVS